MADNNLENRVNHLETKFEVFVQEMRDFKDEMKDFKTEMRQQNEMRAAEIARTDAKIEQLRVQHNADMKEITKEMKEISKEIRGMAITTILGVGAIVAAVMGFSWAIFAPSNSAPVQIQQPPAQTAQIQTTP